jgi:hypothetical protein
MAPCFALLHSLSASAVVQSNSSAAERLLQWPVTALGLSVPAAADSMSLFNTQAELV